MLTRELKSLDQYKEMAMNWMTSLLGTWGLTSFEEVHPETDGPDGVSEHFMGSRMGTNLTFRTFKQLLQHRYLIVQNLMILNASPLSGAQEGMTPEKFRECDPQWTPVRELMELLLRYSSVSQMVEWSAERATDFIV